MAAVLLIQDIQELMHPLQHRAQERLLEPEAMVPRQEVAPVVAADFTHRVEPIYYMVIRGGQVFTKVEPVEFQMLPTEVLVTKLVVLVAGLLLIIGVVVTLMPETVAVIVAVVLMEPVPFIRETLEDHLMAELHKLTLQVIIMEMVRL